MSQQAPFLRNAVTLFTFQCTGVAQVRDKTARRVDQRTTFFAANAADVACVSVMETNDRDM